jgi:amidase
MDDFLFGSATALARAIRTKEVSAVEAATAHLARIEAVNPALNAVVQLAPERALAEAAAADRALARGADLGPLHGLPITLKDSLDTEGIVTTWGTAGRRDFVPDADATVVARLRRAGAIVLGKTNTPEFTLGGEMENAVYGFTYNPHDTSLSPSGSSGGAAAIVAAGGSPLDIGSDTGGSIREPAHVCGIAGIKPTSGRTPRTGHAVPYGIGAVDSLTVLGPLARFVEDLSLVLPLICGSDWRDPAVTDVPLGDPAAVELKGLRVAVYTDGGLVAPMTEIAEAVAAGAEALARRGVLVEEAAPAALAHAGDIHPWLNVANGRDWLRRRLAEAGTAEPGPSIAKLFAEEAALKAPSLAVMLEQLDEYRSAMLQFMEDYDAILCPPDCYAALPHHAAEEIDKHRVWAHLYAYNLTGWPAAVVPAGATNEGLPFGLQIAGRPWREDVVLALAAAIEADLGGYRRPAI